MANQGFFKLGLLDVSGRPVNETGVKIRFVKSIENIGFPPATGLSFPPEHTFAVDAFPQAKALFCEVTTPRFRQRQ